MAAGLLWILDVGNNTAMEPYRAFIADTLDEEQQPVGFQAQSFFTGFGQFLAYISLFLFPIVFIGYTGSLPTWIYASFFLGAILSVTSIWWSMNKRNPANSGRISPFKSRTLKYFFAFH
jgi:maltose/moltooligosaccharide transporter